MSALSTDVRMLLPGRATLSVLVVLLQQDYSDMLFALVRSPVSPTPCSVPVTTCPVLTMRIPNCIRTRCGTTRPISLCTRYAMCGTELAYGATRSILAGRYHAYGSSLSR
eukprot:3940805-Rhodomonas_salina.2